MIRNFAKFSVVFFFTFNLASGSESWFLNPHSKYQIEASTKDLGGLSALHIYHNGLSFLALSDKAKFFQGTISRSPSGVINGLKIKKFGSLRNSKGKILNGRNIDSESIAAIEPAGYYISFESNNRIMMHVDLEKAGKFLPKHSDFSLFGFNKGIEALALDMNGRLHAIPEKPPKGQEDYPIYQLVGSKWEVFARFLPSDSLLVSDAAFLPDNSLLLLERGYNWSSGFTTQLRHLEFNAKTIIKEKVLLNIKSGMHNHEGISVWQDKKGNFFVSLVSDNNFLPLVGSELLEFELLRSK